jgi:valyl-tRNA synthetase
MELDKAYDPHAAEKKWQEFWIKEGIYKFDEKKLDNVYSIDTPPPTVSGAMHMGHAFSYTQCDFIARYHRMTGKNLFYPFGLDDNGLATERYVENKLKIKSTNMSRDEFIKLCLKETTEVEIELLKSWQSLGLSCDWQWQYRTIDEHSRRTSQFSFIELYNDGRIYRKEAPTIWCPECKTAIAQVELEDRDLKSHFNDVLFELEDGKKLTIATTRPELLPACVAVFFHPKDIRYRELEGKNAKVPLFNYSVPIIPDERADPEKGTGIVMCCTFGDQTDAEWWKAYNLPLRMALTHDGRLNELGQKYEGMKIKEARSKIIEDLKNNNLLTKQEEIIHTVNVHERCGTEIEFLVTKQWFLRYLDLKDEFLRLGSEIKWFPEHMKNRYDNWIKGLQWDWCISRQRFFGVPFPMWYCEKCDEVILADEADLPVDPLKDKPQKKCKCGSSDFIPEKDVMDTWATSSLSPQIALNWPEKMDFYKKMFPMSLRPQAHDIISFWLFNTVVKAYFHAKSIPWKHVMISGWALDKHGKKMSKSKGNVIDPLDMLNKYSSDALRFWSSSSKLGEDLWFSEREFVAGNRTIIKLWNAARFVLPHIEDYNLKRPKQFAASDSWILSKLNKLIKTSTEAYEQHDYVRVRLDTEKFFWQDLCDNYLEIVKDRLYNPQNYSKEDVDSAKCTLYEVLLSVLKLFAPILPHITEEIYQTYFSKKENKKSIHVSDWPKCDETLINEEAEKTGELLLSLLSSIRKYKAEHKLSMKEEIKEVVISCDEETRKCAEKIMKELASTMKIKNIDYGPAGQIKLENYDIKLNINA